MKLTNSEKLILTMLSEIYEKLGMNDGHNEIDGNFVKSAIQKNHTWALSWKYQGIAFDEEDQPHEVDEVVNYLDMWDFLEESAGSLSAADQAELVERMPGFAGLPVFKGFDGNNESRYWSTALFMVNHLDSFTRFQGRDLNSHCPLVQRYSRMYAVFEPIRNRLFGRCLTIDEMVSILNA